jgi:CHRD domain
MLSSSVLGLLTVGLASAQPGFNAHLSTVPIDSRSQAQITGHGMASASLTGRALSLSGSFEGLQGAASGAQLHMGPATGVRGPAILDIEVTHAANGTLSASLELDASQVEALRAGRLYVQIDSESAPEGNLWGWLLPQKRR